jgi:hypothetical protein
VPTPKPVVLSPSWFRGLKSGPPLLPPFLQYRFPLNIVLYMSLPFLMPTLVTIALVRLTLASRSSRARVKRLEKEDSSGQRLIHILAQLEKDMEDTVVDLIEDPGNANSDTSLATTSLGSSQHRRDRNTRSEQPILSSAQRKMIGQLNTLPNLKKERAFINRIRNSHASIVCREIKRFPVHRQGEGVLRHWADHFIF